MEFAFIVPLLIVLVLGIAEFGHAFQVQGTLSAAAREGVRLMALQNDPAAPAPRSGTPRRPSTPAITDAQITITPRPARSTVRQHAVRLTITYPMPYLTGFFG